MAAPTACEVCAWFPAAAWAEPVPRVRMDAVAEAWSAVTRVSSWRTASAAAEELAAEELRDSAALVAIP
jgi:hypothetical protein